MPPQTSVAGMPLAPDPIELLQRLRQKSRLWTYIAPPGQSTYESVLAVIDDDSRVQQSEFVLGVVPTFGHDTVAVAGHFDSLVSADDSGGLRKLGTIPVPSSGVSIGPVGHLNPLRWSDAERLWVYLFDKDSDVIPFVAKHLSDSPGVLAELFNDPKRMLRRWHRRAIESAVAIAGETGTDLDFVVLMFAALLRKARERAHDTTLAFVHGRLAETGGIGSDIIDILDLRRYGVRSLDPENRPSTVSSRAAEAINSFIHDAHEVRLRTDGTDDIRTRHVTTAFLRHPAIDSHLASLRFNVPLLRADLFAYIMKNVADVDEARWRRILNVEQQQSQPEPQPPPTPTPREFSIDTIVSRDTWTTDDNLGYSLYAQAITASILNRTTEPPLTIGIQAPWGQGKTSLMRMMQDELDPGAPYRDRVATSLSTVRTAIQTTYARLLKWSWMRSAPKDPGEESMLNETRQKQPAHWPVDEKKKAVDPADKRPRIPTVWFNPLYYRETQQVWAGMAHAILQQLTDRFEDPIEREKFWFRLQQSRINIAAVRRDIHAWVLMRLVPTGFLLVAVALITAVAVALSPASVVWLLKAAGGVTAAATLVRFLIEFARKIDRPFERYVTEPNYQSDLGPLHLIDHDLDRALRLLVGDDPIAVFIDDLDRCDPQTVNQVILAINQFLSLPRRNVYFILGMDMEMVAAALEQAQKEQFGGAVAQRRSFGWRFMEKFVQLPFFIPHLDAGAAQQFAESHLGGVRNAPVTVTAAPQIVEETKKKVEEAATPSAVGAAMAEAAETLPPEEQASLQKAASTKVAELMKTNDSEEMKAIARIAVQDLDLNPRTIVRYFGLVRVLRNIQVSTGNVTSPEADRTLVLRAAHLLMNWPQFVQWLRNEPEIHTTGGAWTSTVEEVERLARGQSMKRWQQGIAAMLRRDTAPQHLADPSLYRFLRRIADDPPGLKAMYDARMF